MKKFFLLLSIISIHCNCNANSIKLTVLNINNEKEIQFDFQLFLSIDGKELRPNTQIPKDSILKFDENLAAILNLKVLDINLECRLPVKFLKEASELIYKLNFNSPQKCMKIFYMNSSGEVLIQDFAKNNCITYQTLEVLNDNIPFGQDLDNSLENWLLTIDGHYSNLNGVHKHKISSKRFINIELKDSSSMTISLESNENILEEISTFWIYKEDFKAIIISQQQNIKFQINPNKIVSFNFCELIADKPNILTLYLITEENGKLTRKELMRFTKE